MSFPKLLSEAQRDEVLRVAIEKQVPLTATVRSGARWIVSKSRFLPRVAGSGLLCIEPPTLDPIHGEVGIGFAQEWEPGTTIGVSFRRGHHKCLFATTVAGRQRVAVNAETRKDAVLIRRPEAIEELQRRAYYRTIVPPEAPLTARLRLGAERQAFEAAVVDVSVGGACVRLMEAPREAPSGGAPFIVTIEGTNCAPLSVDALFRHSRLDEGGTVLWGVQFVGLESSGGRQTLNALSRLVTRLTRINEAREMS